MTIQTIRVVSKYIRTCERFADFLQENILWVESGKLNTTNLDTVLFALNNAQHLRMYTQGDNSDLLALTIYGGMSPRVTVTYLELMTYDDVSYFSPLETEDFPRADLAKAMECFMARWFSANPAKAINPVVRDSRKVIIDFLLKPLHELPVRIHEPIDFTRTPEQIRECLVVRKMAKEYGLLSGNRLTAPGNLRELLLRTKHLDRSEIGEYALGNTTHVVAPDTDEPVVLSPKLQAAFNTLTEDQKASVHVVSGNPHDLENPRDHLSYATKCSADSLPDTDDLKVVFKDGVVMKQTDGVTPISPAIREMAKGVGVVVYEDSDQVQYTGDKDNHGTGSLDHIDW